MKYEVEVTFHSREIVTVEAIDPQDAERIVHEMIADSAFYPEGMNESEYIVGDAKPKRPTIEVKQFQMLPKRDTGG